MSRSTRNNKKKADHLKTRINSAEKQIRLAILLGVLEQAWLMAMLTRKISGVLYSPCKALKDI